MTTTTTTRIHDLVAEVARAVAAANGRRVERTIRLGEALRLIGLAARGTHATTGRTSVASSYGYPAYYTGCDAVRHRDVVVWAVERVSTSHRTPLGVSGWQDRWTADTRARYAELIATAPGAQVFPLEQARRLHGGCGLPGAEYGIRQRDGGVTLYSAAGEIVGRAWRLPALDGRGHYWEHAATRAEALAERARKAAILEAEARAQRLTARQERAARLLARVSAHLSATVADATQLGYCAAGITAWCSARGVDPTAALPVARLAHDPDARAVAVAVMVARRAIQARHVDAPAAQHAAEVRR